MANLRDGKAINKEAFEKSNNTLAMIDKETLEVIFFSKAEDKYEILNRVSIGEFDGNKLIFIWTGVGRSDIFNISAEDITRLLIK